ncbi:MAG: branched-chain amino acid ABC transporter permease [Clostridia bacterium]|nr:branched-chain amino acid ABC transporter permease [Clostridia bacterium]
MEQLKKKFHLGKTNREKIFTFGIVLLFFAVIEILRGTGNLSNLLKGQLVPICAYVVMALSLNLTVGILGELSLGHAGFVSVGAFTGIVTATLLKPVVPQTWLVLLISIVAGGLTAGIIGFLIGIPVLRLRGDYLAIVTLAFGEIVKSLITNLYIGVDAKGLHFSFINDNLNLLEGGKKIIAGPMGASGFPKISTFLAGILLILFVLYFLYRLLGSKMGRAIKAMRDNSIAAEAVGIHLTRFKLTAFTMSAFIAGMAGTLFALNFASLSATKFNVDMSILLLVFVVLGGLGNLRGSIIAAGVLTVLPEMLRSLRDYRMLAYSIVLIAIMLLTNNQRLMQWWTQTKKDAKKWFAKIRKAKDGGEA